MNHGPFIFLGVLVTFVASWWTLIFAPQVQIGSQSAAQTDAGLYPVRRPGWAAQGRDVYVANGCVYCHSQQARQEGYTFDLVLTAVGTNPPNVRAIIEQIAPGIKVEDAFAKASDTAPQPILTGVVQPIAADAHKRLTKAGAGARLVFVPKGSDIDRKWGTRLSVAADYLYDYPVQAGNSRLGPDLANVGARMPDATWHLLHLYDPRTTVKGSIMPAYRYLFETRPVGKKPSPDTLSVPEAFAPKAGYEVVPTPEALQLVAYLQSLRVDTGLFEAPLAAPPPLASTNAPSATNAPAKQ